MNIKRCLAQWSSENNIYGNNPISYLSMLRILNALAEPEEKECSQCKYPNQKGIHTCTLESSDYTKGFEDGMETIRILNKKMDYSKEDPIKK